jgi:hypothetical protein
VCERPEVEAARVRQCDIRSEESLFESVSAIAPIAGKNPAVCSLSTANGARKTSTSSGKLEPIIGSRRSGRGANQLETDRDGISLRPATMTIAADVANRFRRGTPGTLNVAANAAILSMR